VQNGKNARPSAGRGGPGPNRGKGGGPRQPDPMQTAVGFIGADAFTRKKRNRSGGSAGAGGGGAGGGGRSKSARGGRGGRSR
jgi:23S rRNA pseudouridine2605 synthase